jgi:hypothetical protein
MIKQIDVCMFLKIIENDDQRKKFLNDLGLKEHENIKRIVSELNNQQLTLRCRESNFKDLHYLAKNLEKYDLNEERKKQYKQLQSHIEKLSVYKRLF